MDRKRIAYLDFSRGLAVILVVLVHVSQRFSFSGWLGDVLRFGQFGVQWFFIISSTTFVLKSEKYLYKSLNIYLLYVYSRWKRLFPLMLIATFLYVLKTLLLGNGLFLKDIYGAVLGLVMLNGFASETVLNLVPGSWSISTEMLFYILLPFLLVLRKRMFNALYLFVLLQIVVWYVLKRDINSFGGIPYFYPFFHIFSFILPLIFAMQVDKIVLKKEVFLASIWAGVLVIAYCWLDSNFIVVMISMNLFWLSLTRILSKLISYKSLMVRLFIKLGKNSYGIYLFHFLFLGIANLFPQSLVSLLAVAIIVLLISHIFLVYIINYLERIVSDYL